MGPYVVFHIPSKNPSRATNVAPADPLLTAVGIEQATMASRLWKEELQHQIPFPEKMYCSPLRRALHTNVITFEEKTEPERLILEVKCLNHQPGGQTR